MSTKGNIQSVMHQNPAIAALKIPVAAATVASGFGLAFVHDPAQSLILVFVIGGMPLLMFLLIAYIMIFRPKNLQSPGPKDFHDDQSFFIFYGSDRLKEPEISEESPSAKLKPEQSVPNRPELEPVSIVALTEGYRGQYFIFRHMENFAWSAAYAIRILKLYKGATPKELLARTDYVTRWISVVHTDLALGTEEHRAVFAEKFYDETKRVLDAIAEDFESDPNVLLVIRNLMSYVERHRGKSD